MKSKLFKGLVPMAVAGAAMLVLAMPTRASAHDWDHHDNGHHYGWYKHDYDDHYNYHRDRYDEDEDCDEQGGYYPPSYYPAPPIRYSYRNNPRMNYLQQEWAKAEAKHQRALANGNRYAAKVTSRRLYQLDRDMGSTNGYGPYYNGYYNNGYDNNGYYNSAPVLGPVGNLLGIR